MYKIKRFSFIRKLLKGTAIGALSGGGGAILSSMAEKGEKSLGAIAGGLLGGAIGGVISTGKYIKDKLKESEQKQLEEIAEKIKEAKAKWEREIYPKKEDEVEYKRIVAAGGMPKEYYQAVEIKKKMARKEYIDELDVNDYLLFFTEPLKECDEWLKKDNRIKYNLLSGIFYQVILIVISFY